MSKYRTTINLPYSALEEPTVQKRILMKLWDQVNQKGWDANDFSHNEYDFFITSDIKIENAILYSTILTPAKLDANVPLDWPGSQLLDDEGNPTTRVKVRDWFRTTEVTGGTVVQFSEGPVMYNEAIMPPSWDTLKTQLNLAGGFLTKAEVEAIKIVPVEE